MFKFYKLLQLLSAFAVSMGSLIVGFSSGYTSPALPSMTNVNGTSFLEINDEEVNLS